MLLWIANKDMERTLSMLRGAEEQLKQAPIWSVFATQDLRIFIERLEKQYADRRLDPWPEGNEHSGTTGEDTKHKEKQIRSEASEGGEGEEDGDV